MAAEYTARLMTASTTHLKQTQTWETSSISGSALLPKTHTHACAHTRAPERLRAWPWLLTVQRRGAAWISYVCISSMSPAQHALAAIDRTQTIFLLPSLALSLSFSLRLSTLSLPPFSSSCPSCCCSQRPFRAYLTKQHTTHAAYLSPPCSLPLSLCEKTEILNLAAAAMSHDLATPSHPPFSHSPSLLLHLFILSNL